MVLKTPPSCGLSLTINQLHGHFVLLLQGWKGSYLSTVLKAVVLKTVHGDHKFQGSTDFGKSSQSQKIVCCITHRHRENLCCREKEIPYTLPPIFFTSFFLNVVTFFMSLKRFPSLVLFQLNPMTHLVTAVQQFWQLCTYT